MQRLRSRTALLAAMTIGLGAISGMAASASTDTTAAAGTTAATGGTTAATGDTTAASEGTTAGTAGASVVPEVECPDSEDGLTDTEVKIGGTYPLSGPAAAYASIPKGIDAWFQHLNETDGGITFGDGVTRKVSWEFLDDGYTPNKALENVRNLIENQGVWFVFNPLGTPNNLAIRDYMNENEVPQLFVATGASTWGRDHETYPWTIGFQPDYESEGIAFAQYILSENPDAKIGVLYQNDDFGKDYLNGLKMGLGDSADQLVSEVTYELTDPSIDSQVSQVIDAGVDAFVLIATPQFAIQGIQRTAALGFDGIRVLSSVSSSVGGVIEPAGFDAANGWVTSVYLKDPTSPEFQEDPAIVEYKEILAAYDSSANPDDGFYLYGMNAAQTLAKTFEQMTSVCRAGLMASAENLAIPGMPLLRDGISVQTGEGDYFPLQQVQMEQFDGSAWVPFGDVLDASTLHGG